MSCIAGPWNQTHWSGLASRNLSWLKPYKYIDCIRHSRRSWPFGLFGCRADRIFWPRLELAILTRNDEQNNRDVTVDRRRVASSRGRGRPSALPLCPRFLPTRTDATVIRTFLLGEWIIAVPWGGNHRGQLRRREFKKLVTMFATFLQAASESERKVWPAVPRGRCNRLMLRWR